MFRLIFCVIDLLFFRCSSMHTHMLTKEHLHHHNVAAGMVHRSLSKRARDTNKLHASELVMMLPFMFIVALPLSLLSFTLYLPGLMIEKMISCLVADKGEAGCLRIVVVRSLEIARYGATHDRT